jgi:mannose-6-phosphate isomerase
MSFTAPIGFVPWLRPMPWGGHALTSLLQLPDRSEPVGEAWLLSDHPLHRSIVADGPLKDKSIQDLIRQDSEALLGSKMQRFPLLVKILDARENLSVQVHPDDDAARQWAPQEGGKTEAWTVLGSAPGGVIYLGLKRGIDKTVLQRELVTGNLVSCLQRHEPKAGETYYVPAGTVHALGGGVTVLEVQQTSDATFRLYDWERLGADGKPRELHLEAGLACTKENVPAVGLQHAVKDESHSQILVRSPFFTVKQLREDCVTQIKAPALLFLWKGLIEIYDHAKFSRAQAILIPHSLGAVSVEVGFETTLFEISWAS